MSFQIHVHTEADDFNSWYAVQSVGAYVYDCLESGRANGCQRQLWRPLGCCKGLRGPSAGPSRSAGGPEAKRAAARALSGA